jgi:uncharacterized protein YecE (DUF72 family)
LPSEKTLQQWCAAVPDGFCINLNAPRTITYYKKLKNAGAQVNSF